MTVPWPYPNDWLTFKWSRRAPRFVCDPVAAARGSFAPLGGLDDQLRFFQYPGRRFRWAIATITISVGLSRYTMW